MNPDPVEETKNLPLSQRLEHQHWKVRMVAYEELAKKFAEAEDANAPMFAEYSGILKKIITDKNAVSLEKGLSTLISFYDRYEQASRYTSQLAGPLVEKCLGARPKTKEDATTVLLLMIEVDKEAESVVSALIEGTKSKVPKIAAASVAVLEQAIKTFGVKAIPVKEILKEFGNWFDHTNADVRAAATACTVELRRWLGGILDKPIQKLREAQQKDLAKLFEEMPKDPAAPLKYRRFEVDAMMAAAASGASSSAAGQAKELDEYELAEAANILSKATPQFYTDLQSKKWKERKEALEALVAVSDSPKLESGDYGELTRALKKCLGDPNVFVVELATRMIGLLGRGLRKEFAQLGRSCVSSMFDKFKDKKQSVVSAIHEALERMHPHCFTLLDIVEDLEGAADNKVPTVKAEMLNFVIKCLKTTNKVAITKNVKPFCGIFMKLMGDGDPTVREKSFEAFGVLIGVVGERTLQGYIAKLEPIQEKRVREFIPTGPVGVSGPSAPSPAPAPAAIDAAELAAIAADVATSESRQLKKAAAAKATATGSSSAPAASKKQAPPTEAPVPAAKKASGAVRSATTAKASPSKRKEETIDDAAVPASGFPVDTTGRADISSRLQAKLLSQLDDADWKKRHEALIQVEQILVDANRKIQLKGVFELVNALKKRLNDSNKNLVQVTLNLLGDLATAVGAPIAEMMKLIIPSIFNNFTDNKQNVKDAAASCLDKWVAEVTIDAFFSYFHNAIALPSGKKEILKWISTHIPQASKKADFKPLIKDILTCLEDKAKDVRVQSEPIVAEIARRVGIKPIEAEISRLKPASAGPIRQLLSTITASATPAPVAPAPNSIVSAPSVAPKTPTRASVGAANRSRFGVPEALTESPARQSANLIMEDQSTPVVTPQGPVLRNNSKAQREQEALSWSFDEAPRILIEALKRQAQDCFSPELLSKMFDSSEAKDLAEALSEIEAALESYKEGVLDSLDVILKWTSLRLFDSNLVVLRKAVTLFSQLLGMLEIWQVTLSEFEAQSFILIFVERMGVVSHDMVLQAMRSVLKQFNKLYPASKTFKIILTGALSENSKLNAQSRAECLKYLGLLIHQQSLSVCTPSDALPVIAYWINDSDAFVAESAVETLAEASRFLEKDTMWTFLPKLPAGQRDLIQKKVSNPTMQVVASARATTIGQSGTSSPVQQASPSSELKPTTIESAPILGNSQQARRLTESLPKGLFQLDLESLAIPSIQLGSIELVAPSKTSIPSFLLAESPESKVQVGESLLSRAPGRLVASWISDLNGPDAAKAIETLKLMALQFKETSSEDAIFFPHIDKLVFSLSCRLLNQLHLPAEPSESFRQLKYMLNAVMLILGKKYLAKSLSTLTLKKLMQSLLQPMLDEVLNTKEEGKQLLKAFNVAVLKALDHCERTHAFVALLQLMRELIPQLDVASNTKQSYPKMAELVLKCLLKLVKVLTATISDLSLDAVLRELHLFFVAHPPDSWKKRVDEVPLETAKTVLDRFVKLKGFDICKHLSLIPAVSSQPQPIIYSLIRQLLRAHFPEVLVDEASLNRAFTSETAEMFGEILGGPLHETGPLFDEEPLFPTIQLPQSILPPPQIFVPKPSSAPQIKEALSIVRRRLLMKETSLQALVDLFYISRDHSADVDIAQLLESFSPQFALFLKERLGQLAICTSASKPALASLPTDLLVDIFNERADKLKKRFSISTNSELAFVPRPSLAPTWKPAPLSEISSSLPQALPSATTTQVQSVTLTKSTIASDKSNISALRERLKQAAAVAPVSEPPIPTHAIEPSFNAPVIEVHAQAPVQASAPTTGTSQSLANLRERLARIKGGQ